MKRINAVCSAFIVSFFLLSVANLTGAGVTELSVPKSPNKWVNDGPYSPLALQNKTVVFYFYEED